MLSNKFRKCPTACRFLIYQARKNNTIITSQQTIKFSFPNTATSSNHSKTIRSPMMNSSKHKKISTSWSHNTRGRLIAIWVKYPRNSKNSSKASSPNLLRKELLRFGLRRFLKRLRTLFGIKIVCRLESISQRKVERPWKNGMIFQEVRKQSLLSPSC